MQELTTQDATASNSDTTSNIMDDLQQSILGAAHTTSEALAQCETDREASRTMAMEVKRDALAEAMKRLQPPDLRFQCVSCQCKRKCFNDEWKCPWFDCAHDWDGCSACVVRVRGEEALDA